MEKTSKKIRYNLGCGADYLSGWVNIDKSEAITADIYCDIRDFEGDGDSVSEILLSHVIMYLRPEELEPLLVRWYGWLKVGGLIEIETINFDQVLDYAKLNDKSYGLDCIFGTEVTQTHRWGWNITRLRDLMIKSGFKDLEIKDGSKNPRRDFKIIAVK